MKDYITESLQPGEQVLAELTCGQLGLSYLGAGQSMSAETATVGLTNRRFYVLVESPRTGGLSGHRGYEEVFMTPLSNILAAHFRVTELTKNRLPVVVWLTMGGAALLTFQVPHTETDLGAVEALLGRIVGQPQTPSVGAQDTTPIVAWKKAEEERERKRRQED